MKKLILAFFAIGFSCEKACAKFDIEPESFTLSFSQISRNLEPQINTLYSPRTWAAMKEASPALLTPRSTNATIQYILLDQIDAILEDVPELFLRAEEQAELHDRDLILAEQAELQAIDLILTDIRYLFAHPVRLPLAYLYYCAQQA